MVVLEKKIFKVFTILYGHGSNLGHVNWVKYINWHIGSGEEDFWKFLPYTGMTAILVR